MVDEKDKKGNGNSDDTPAFNRKEASIGDLMTDELFEQIVVAGQAQRDNGVQQIPANMPVAADTQEAQKLPTADNVEYGLGELGTNAAGYYSDLEVVVKFAFGDDFRFDPVEANNILDAMQRTGDTHEKLVATAYDVVNEWYYKFKEAHPEEPGKQVWAARRAMEAMLDSAELFYTILDKEDKKEAQKAIAEGRQPITEKRKKTDPTESRDNVYKVVKFKRRMDTDIDMTGLKERYEAIEAAYNNKYHLNDIIPDLGRVDLSGLRGVQLSLEEAVDSIEHTIRKDQKIDNSELKIIQGVYEDKPISKYELLIGINHVLAGLLERASNMKDLTPAELDGAYTRAVVSAQRIRKEIVQKPGDLSTDAEMNKEMYQFGLKIGKPELLVEYKRSFRRSDQLSQFMNVLQGILKDWKIDPAEYKQFDEYTESADISFENGIGLAAEMLVTKLRKIKNHFDVERNVVEDQHNAELEKTKARYQESLEILLKKKEVSPEEYKSHVIGLYNSYKGKYTLNFKSIKEEEKGKLADIIKREYNEEKKKAEGELKQKTDLIDQKAEAAITERRIKAGNIVTTLMTYRLGRLPSRQDELTKSYYKLLGETVHRINNFDKNDEDVREMLKSESEKREAYLAAPERCRSRFTQEIQSEKGPTTLEKEIQREILIKRIATALTGIQIETAEEHLANQDVVEYTGQKLFVDENQGVDIAVLEMLPSNGKKKCVVRMSTNNDSNIRYDKETGITKVRMGAYKKMMQDGTLDSMTEQGFGKMFDPAEKGTNHKLYVPRSLTIAPTITQQQAEIKPTLQKLEIDVDRIYGTFTDKYKFVSAARIMDTGRRTFELDELEQHMQKNKDVTIDYEALSKARMISTAMGKGEYSRVLSGEYNGIALMQPMPGAKVQELANGNKRIALRNAYIVCGSDEDYTIGSMAEGEINVTTHRAVSHDRGPSTMYLEICEDRKSKLYGARLIFQDANKSEPIRLNYVPYIVSVGGPVSPHKEHNKVMHQPLAIKTA